MEKKIDEMNDRELLQELVRQGRKREKADRVKTAVTAALLLVLIVVLLVYVPRITAPIRELNRNMDQIRQTMSEAQALLSGFNAEKLAKLDRVLDEAQGFFSAFSAEKLAKLEHTMDTLAETTEQARDFMDKMKDLDLAGLKSTLDNLNNSLGLIGKLFNR